MNEQTIGLVGLGLLGSALAERLIRGGWCVVGYDLDVQRCQEFEALGGQVSGSPRDVAVACRRVMLSLPTTDIVETVVEQMGDALDRGAVLIDTTTGDPDPTAALGARLARVGVEYLDATVSGSSAQARQGEITFMVGGSAEAFQACRDVFACLADRSFHVGPIGSGAKMKLVVNLVLGLNRAALAEALALAERLELPTGQALTVLKAGAAYSRAMDTKGQKMVDKDFTTQARLTQHLKDVRLMLSTAQRAGAKLPFSTLHAELLEQLEAAGYGDADNSAIIQAFR